MDQTDSFIPRHIGPNEADVAQMLQTLDLSSLDELVAQTVPPEIRLKQPLKLPQPRNEFEALNDLKAIASKNKVVKSMIGQGYYGTITPPVIQRNIFENPGWYTQYTPYQAEIAQGRLEALLNFQTMVADLTGLPLANASLLDEGTAAAEAMAMAKSIAGAQKNEFVIDGNAHPQTIAVVQTRARSLGIELRISRRGHTEELLPSDNTFGVLIQHPGTDGRIPSLDAVNDIVDDVHSHGGLVIAATDLLACSLIEPPGQWGADIAVGSAQRFGVPIGFGGPHAAFMATKPDYARKLPGRLVGVSKDAQGNPALRLAIQTREQHIRREKATSNICTAQVLLAIMSSMYAVWHGPEGLKRIASRIHFLASALAAGLERVGHEVLSQSFFDTIHVRPKGLPVESILASALSRNINLRNLHDGTLSISCDETTTPNDIEAIIESFSGGATFRLNLDELAQNQKSKIKNRKSPYLTHPIFNTHHSETEMLRYIKKLESRDLSLAYSMIPLGSCTMKLNATAEMFPVSWPEFSRLHPFAPKDQTEGYHHLFSDLEKWLAEITGFAAVSLQPNAGSQGEYAGLLAIRAYHESQASKTQHSALSTQRSSLRTQHSPRNICLIPTSAHGTNPASAVIAGFKVLPVACDDNGNIEISNLKSLCEQHKSDLAALMVTYPSTHGVFEESIREICQIVHAAGGQVYMDGANMNAQVGLCRPGDIGADVCHLNLHKTFCIPHGGGGPGMGPIAVAQHLAPFLPSIENQKSKIENPVGPVSSAPHGSASILPIPWMYIAMMGEPGLKRATQVAILNANYMAARLAPHYPVLFKGKNGRVAHEFVLDCRQFEQSAGIKVEDIAKRLMDYGFHAPTMSWPVPGTLMIEPTESESKVELDRFCDALISIRNEIRSIEKGESDRTDNPLKNSPHTASAISSDSWSHPYSRQLAAFPAPWVKDHKFWPSVARIDNPYGDRNLVCTCPPMDVAT